jgi:hypothetical protein
LRASSLTPKLLVLGKLTIDPDNGFGESQVKWTGPGVLQSSDSLSGGWTDVEGGSATSPYNISVSVGNTFYRLKLTQ